VEVTIVNDDKTYLTQEGYDRLEEELRALVEVRRPQVAEMIREAKEGGDLRENAAYDEAKDQQAFVEGRIQHIEDILRRAEVFASPNGNDAVALGSKVTVQEEGGQPEDFRLVGSAEADPLDGLISNESPLGSALVGKRVGEVATFETPAGDTISFTILEIS
jgi:transcription elongation factor GreA